MGWAFCTISLLFVAFIHFNDQYNIWAIVPSLKALGLFLGYLHHFSAFLSFLFISKTNTCRTSFSTSLICRRDVETSRPAALVDLQSPLLPPVATCYCRRSLVCYCRPATLEQSTCRLPVCPITHNISSQTKNLSISAIISRHCSLTASP